MKEKAACFHAHGLVRFSLLYNLS